MRKLRMTVVYEYDADPEFYESDDPKKMIKIDMENWSDLLADAIRYDESDVKVKIEEVED